MNTSELIRLLFFQNDLRKRLAEFSALPVRPATSFLPPGLRRNIAKQAIAIGISEARKEGSKVPRKKSSSKNSSSKKVSQEVFFAKEIQLKSKGAAITNRSAVLKVRKKVGHAVRYRHYSQLQGIVVRHRSL